MPTDISLLRGYILAGCIALVHPYFKFQAPMAKTVIPTSKTFGKEEQILRQRHARLDHTQSLTEANRARSCFVKGRCKFAVERINFFIHI